MPDTDVSTERTDQPPSAAASAGPHAPPGRRTAASRPSHSGQGERVEALKDLTLLADICVDYLGCTFDVARRKFSRGELPLKAFRLSGTRRGPIYVHNDDLEDFVAKQRKKATVGR